MKKRNIIFDTDPGIDDAIALFLILKNLDKLNLLLVTTVFGNVSLEKTTKNALNLLNYAGFNNIPVAKGANSAIIYKENIDAGDVHGEDGIGGININSDNSNLLLENAVEAMKNAIINSKEKVTIVAVGALTNVATLLLAYPNLKEKIEEIVIMGGSTTGGNTNTAAEFNIYLDPHAAKIVFEEENIPITVFSLDVTRNSKIYIDNFEKVKDNNKLSKLSYEMFLNYRSETSVDGLIMHDSTTILYLLKKDLFTFEKKYIDIALSGPARGTFVADYYTIRNENKKKNINYAIGVNSEEFEKTILNMLSK